ncbi:hypothetical protein [Ekhidna sp.]|uniref:hypothetical protein n=1 Tax=Ekhidna sp. TaxID=2608089 RepID=UPI003297921C
MKTLSIKQLALIIILLLTSCQEDKILENPEPFDEDMSAATLIADEYFNDLGGRSDKYERAITILKYKDGQIYYNTNTDDIEGYQVVTETTVTAYVEPGEYVFWYRGGGLDDLEEVDFDEDAEAYLDQLPEEYKADSMWVLQIPTEYDSTHSELKYDIVYESKDNEGVVIRLDPKITIGGQTVVDPEPAEETPEG